MPSARSILEHLSTVANEAVGLAILWHAVCVVVIVALLLGWRPSVRLAGMLLVLPVASAAALAFRFQNPFNGMLLGALAVVLAVWASRLPATEVRSGRKWASLAGVLFVAFGLCYPHFVETGSLVTYLYAAPMGLIPCPTLALVIGFALLAGDLQRRAWSLALASVGLFYGLFGVLRLRVLMDIPLIVGAAVLLAAAAVQATSIRRSAGAATAPARA